MNNSTLEILEYNKILDILSSFSKTYIGKNLISELQPSFSSAEVSNRLLQTNQAVDIINKLILNESVSIADVNDVIDRHKRVIINYHTKGEDKNTGARVVEVYAYGLTKAGNPVIRCFQPYGDTTSRVPSWKFFRLDRISAWKETNQTFNRPADFFYKGLGDFNPNGDDTMSVVYKIAKFGSNNIINTEIQTPTNGPRMKSSSTEPYRTDTERGMERLRQQLQNPKKIDLDKLRRR